MYKVCVIGPECTGKTSLAKYLANFFQTVFVPEYARAYLDSVGRLYEKEDLSTIAYGQIAAEKEKAKNAANNLLICDTNLLVIKIWSEYKYGTCATEILTLHKQQHYDGYLLTDVDIPWEEDPQREHPDKREFFFNLYEKEVLQSGVPFCRISGTHQQREKVAVEFVKQNVYT